MGKWLIAYALFCVVVFSILTGSVVFAYTHVGFDPLTGYGLPEIQDVYIYHGDNGYTVYYSGHSASFDSNVPLDIPIGQCEAMTLTVNIIKPAVHLNMSEVASSYCGQGVLPGYGK